MKRIAMLALGAAICAAPLAFSGSLAAQAKDQAYQAPRNAFGQPDLGEYWSNASLTPETRPASYGAQAVYTPEQVAQMENAVAKEAVEGNKPTDPHAPPPTKGGDKPPPGTRPEFAAAGGNVGGYNYGWLDPGSRVMRVDGQPRTSIINTANGRAPPFKAGVNLGGGGRGGYGGLGSFDNPENSASAASWASAATPGRPCWPTASTTTTTRSFRAGTTSPFWWRWCTTCASSA